MAEILGTVVGVVSLGLQVCSGLNAYLDGIRGWEEDIASTVRNSKTMETRLKQIESLRGQLVKSSSPSIAALQEHISEAETELLVLGDYINKIHKDNTSSSRSIAEKVRLQKNKVLYPFRRDHLDRLNGRLEKTNKALQDAIQLIGLELSFESGKTIRDMDTCLSTLTQDVADTTLDMRTSILELKETGSQALQDNMAILEGMSELNTMMTALLSSGSVALVPRMASKPDVLKRVCDNVGEVDHLLGVENPHVSPRFSSTEVVKASEDASSPYPEVQCRCSSRGIARRKKLQLGPAFIQEAVIERGHLAGCPYAGFDVDVRSKWSVGISIKAFRKCVSTAISLTMASALGAGGFGMSPSISFYNVRDKSPAFQVVNLLEGAFFHTWTPAEATELVRRAIKTLQATFTAKTSSPLDINGVNHTLLHAVSRCMTRHDEQAWKALIEFLVRARVPRDLPDQNGNLPVQLAFQSICDDYEASLNIHIFDTLWPEKPLFEFDIPEMDDDAYIGDNMKVFEAIVNESTRISKFYEGHPLEAIYTQDKKGLLETLSRDPSVVDLSIVGAAGNTALHHLIQWPEGLSIILSHFGQSTFQRFETTASAVETALLWSGATCVSPITVECVDACACTASLNLLLQAGVFQPTTRPWDELWPIALAKASWRARNLAIDELKRRRGQLKELALSHLKPTDIDRLALAEPQVLDQHTGEVLQLLMAAGVNVPPQLMTKCKCKENGMSTSLYHQITSTYHNLKTGTLAETLYSKGFHDIDTPDGSGVTPLADAYGHINFSIWLINHGASLERRIPGNMSRSTVAHHLLSNLGAQAGLPIGRKRTLKLMQLVRDIGPSNLYMDECRCACSVDGCHPYTSMWKEASEWWLEYRMPGTALSKMTKAIYEQCIVIEEGWDIPRDIVSICLRACTFATLPIRHTCCRHVGTDISGDPFRFRKLTMLEDSEIQEIREEDAVELERLEELILEFEKKIDEMDCSVAEFFRTHWATRMAEVLDEIEGQTLTEEEIVGARKLGVSLEVEEQTEREDQTRLEYWYRELDSLVE